jgi:hypothetical protein
MVTHTRTIEEEEEEDEDEEDDDDEEEEEEEEDDDDDDGDGDMSGDLGASAISYNCCKLLNISSSVRSGSARSFVPASMMTISYARSELRRGVLL